MATGEQMELAMAELGLGRTLLELQPCRYGYSRIQFRGPEADLDAPYIAFLGATETVGPFLTRPFPALVADKLGFECANLGVKNAGPDVFLNDPEILRVARGAAAVVIEVMGASNLSNAFYKVHPRRNDRFIKAHLPLLSRAPDLDLTEVHFTGHLMQKIAVHAPELIDDVVAELRATWVERMQALVRAVGKPVHLLRFVDGPGAPPTAALVEPMMTAAVASKAMSITRVRPSQAATDSGTSEMFFAAPEAPVAARMLSAEAHREVAEALALSVGGHMKKARAG
ncbi:MAG: DUF6473 family protein [Pseudomonadota bacterium]